MTTNTSDTVQQVPQACRDIAADLRDLAALAESNPFVAEMLRFAYSGKTFWPRFASDDYSDGRAAMADAIRVFKSIARGPIEKKYDSEWFDAVINLRALSVKLTDERDKVCERVVVGTREITEEVPDPAVVAAAPKVTTTRTEEVVEWRCAPILGDASKAVA